MDYQQQPGADTEQDPFVSGLVHGLLTALQFRDAETIAHCRRVITYTLLLAEELGFDPRYFREIALGAALHDIGKIGLADAVLRKPGRLTAAEMRHVQEHPVLGYNMVRSSLHRFPLALRMIRNHHERFDGRGYPDGLKGESIPLVARMFSVADAFDAMTSDRPYARAQPVDRVLAELRRHRGSQFCPDCLDGFLSLDPRILSSVKTGVLDRATEYLDHLPLP